MAGKTSGGKSASSPAPPAPRAAAAAAAVAAKGDTHAEKQHDGSGSNGRGTEHTTKERATGKRTGNSGSRKRNSSNASTASDAIPRIVGNYEMGRTLGQGSFGKVKLATSRRSNEKVAIKIVEKSTIANVEDVERVYRETFILTTLKHKHIIKLFEVIDTPSAILLAMEYAGGGELFTLVSNRGCLTEVDTCRLFHQIVSGVEYCHRAKIIHRDLKLENILLDEDGMIKIADFGLSNSIKFGQKMGTHCGTPSYTCPELITAATYSGPAADIWSLGVILFAMICGFLPFEAPNVPALFRKIRHRHFKIPPWVSKEAADLIDRMLCLDPTKRMALSEIRNHPWFLMEYTDLADRLEALPKVTPQQMADARKACVDVAEEEYAKTMADREARHHSAYSNVVKGSAAGSGDGYGHHNNASLGAGHGRKRSSVDGGGTGGHGSHYRNLSTRRASVTGGVSSPGAELLAAAGIPEGGDKRGSPSDARRRFRRRGSRSSVLEDEKASIARLLAGKRSKRQVARKSSDSGRTLSEIIAATSGAPKGDKRLKSRADSHGSVIATLPGLVRAAASNNSHNNSRGSKGSNRTLTGSGNRSSGGHPGGRKMGARKVSNGHRTLPSPNLSGSHGADGNKSGAKGGSFGTALPVIPTSRKAKV